MTRNTSSLLCPSYCPSAKQKFDSLSKRRVEEKLRNFWHSLALGYFFIVILVILVFALCYTSVKVKFEARD